MRAVNLIPSEQRSGQPVGSGRSQGGAYAVLLVVAGLALLAFLYGRARHQITSGHTQITSLAAQTQQAQTAADQLAPYTSFIALREQRTQAVQTLADSRFDWAHVMHEFGRVLPPATSISSLSGTIAGTTALAAAPTSTTAAPAASATATSATSAESAVASATPPGSVPTFTIAGCATSQTAVALTLERLHLIDGVAEVTLQSSTAGSGGPTTGGGGCSGHDASFAAQVSFDPLPSTSAVASASKTAAKTVSNPANAGTAAGQTSTSGVNAR